METDRPAAAAAPRAAAEARPVAASGARAEAGAGAGAAGRRAASRRLAGTSWPDWLREQAHSQALA